MMQEDESHPHDRRDLSTQILRGIAASNTSATTSSHGEMTRTITNSSAMTNATNNSVYPHRLKSREPPPLYHRLCCILLTELQYRTYIKFVAVLYCVIIVLLVVNLGLAINSDGSSVNLYRLVFIAVDLVFHFVIVYLLCRILTRTANSSLAFAETAIIVITSMMMTAQFIVLYYKSRALDLLLPFFIVYKIIEVASTIIMYRYATFVKYNCDDQNGQVRSSTTSNLEEIFRDSQPVSTSLTGMVCSSMPRIHALSVSWRLLLLCLR